MTKRIGFACAYTPLPLIHAAGFVPYRILPKGEAPDQAGSLLHDNMCPHVKRILDRALAADLPPLSGVVFMNSCDAMRRLSDAWQIARPELRAHLVDLPVACDERSVAYFADELGRLRACLAEWAGRPVSDEAILRSAASYDELAQSLRKAAEHAAAGRLPGGRAALQELYLDSVTLPVDESIERLERVASCLTAPAASKSQPAQRGVPVFLFGNVLSDPAAFELFEECGVHVLADDLCTGSRQITPLARNDAALDGPRLDGSGDLLRQLADAVLSRPPCARTALTSEAGGFARHIAAQARDSGARGVIAHVMKFCDPYLARLPAIRAALQEAGLPLLVLEGDCSLRSLGQHRTRIEAFAEMLSGDGL